MDALSSLRYFVPELILLGTAFLVLLVDLLLSPPHPHPLPPRGRGKGEGGNQRPLAIIGLFGIVSALAFVRYPAEPLPLFFGFFLLDPFSFFFKVAALGIIALTLLVSIAYNPLTPTLSPSGGEGGVRGIFGEYIFLFLLLAFGLILMGSSNNLLMIFLSIEFVSILSYLLVGFLKRDSRSKEAALKYLLFGSVASGTMLYGMSILFGLTGVIDLNGIQARLASQPVSPALVLTALLFVTVGLGFKISMAPFHMWAPDVYEGAPTPVTAFLTVGPKALGFALLLRVLHTSFLELWNQWGSLLAILSMFTMTIGNVVAISQTNVKRLLGYSSIAQAGYMLMGLSVSNSVGVTGVLVYLLAYIFTNLGAFLCVIAISNHFGSDEIDSYAGLSQKSPFLALALTLFLLSLAGIPPLAGFIGKFYVFASAIEGRFFTLAVVAALNSAVAAYYYFKVVRLMYLVPAMTQERIAYPPLLLVALALTLAGVLALGIFPSPFIAFVERSLIL